MQAVAQIPADSVRRVVRTVFTQPDYQWVARREPLLWLRRLWFRFVEWIDSLSRMHPVGYNALLVVLVIVLVLMLAHIGYVVWRITRRSTGESRAEGPGGGVLHDAAQHLARAEELASGGRYVEALGHRFLAAVLELDRSDALKFHASKTPAEYVWEVRLDDTGRASFRALVAELYRHLFGAVPCAEAEYRAFGAVAQELTRHVVPA
ncbi:MAG TPA: hypothetical protein VGU74_15055 [Gemmatimonadales bacterium]|nr:hypothetical protein [Gemmatimonadales bacterium]